MQTKRFVTPADVAGELDISTSTVLRKIHRGEIPAIAVSNRIYRIPAASFELFKAGRLKTPQPAPVGATRARRRIGTGEPKPASVPVKAQRA
jgi:excisionase family DNA binding protein